MTQPLIRILQIEESELTLRIITTVRENVVLDDISDVNSGSPSVGQALVWNGTSWAPSVVAGVGGGGDGIQSITPATGDLVVYDDTPFGSPPAGSPATYRNTKKVRLVNNNQLVLAGVTAHNFGSPRLGGSPQTVIAGSPANKTSLEITSTAPGLMLYDTDAPGNEKAWRFVVDDGDFIGEMRSDSGKTSNRWIELTRSGTRVDDFYLYVGQQERFLHAIRGAAVELYHNNINVAETTTAAGGGLRVNNLATGSGFERVLTTSDIGAGGGGGVSFIAGDGLEFINSPQELQVDATVIRYAGSPISAGSPSIGDILYDDGTGRFVRLPLGQAGQVLYTRGSPSVPIWKTLSSSDFTGSPVNPTNVVGGDGIIVTKGSPEVLVAVDGTVLRTTSSLDDLGDVLAGSPTLGAILYSDGTNWLKLPKGTGGQFLRIGSPEIPTWQTYTVTTGSPTDQINVAGGDGITVTKGSPEVTVAVDSTVARLDQTNDGDFRLNGSPITAYVNHVMVGTNYRLNSINVPTWSVQDFTNFALRDGVKIALYGPTDTGRLEINHDDTDLIFQGISTTDWNIQGFSGVVQLFNSTGMWVRDGAYLRISDSGDTDYAQFSHDGTDFNTAFTNTAAWNLTSLSTLDLHDGAELRIYDATNTDVGRFYHDGTNFYTNFGSPSTTTNMVVLGSNLHVGGVLSSAYKFAVGTTADPTGSLVIADSSGRVGIRTTSLSTDLNIGGGKQLGFESDTGGLITGVTTLRTNSGSTGQMTLGTENLRVGGDVGGGRANIVGTANTLPALAIQEGQADQILISFEDTGGNRYLELVHTGFNIDDNASGLSRYDFKHEIQPASADGDGVGFALRTENISGNPRDVAYIDAVYDDISADSVSLRFSVRPGTADANPVEYMRIQGDTGTISFGGSPSFAIIPGSPNTQGMLVRNLVTGTGLERVLTTSDLGVFGSPTDQINVAGGDGITTTYGSPEVTIAVDNTVARLNQTNEGFFRLNGSPTTAYAQFSHDGTGFNTTFTNTDHWELSGLTGQFRLLNGVDMWIRDGGFLRISDAGDTDYVTMTHDGTNFTLTATNTTHLNLSNFGGQVNLNNGMDVYWNDAGRAVFFDSTSTNSFTIQNDDTWLAFDNLGMTGVRIKDGAIFRIEDSGGTDFIEMFHDGTDATNAYTNTTNVHFEGATNAYIFWNQGSPRIEIGRFTSAAGDYQLILRSINDQGQPALAFGDGDSGLFEVSDDNIAVSIAGTYRWLFTGDRLQANNTAGPQFESSAASSTNATIRPNRGNSAGIGAASAGQVSIISGGVEYVRVPGGSPNQGMLVRNLVTGTGLERVLTVSDLKGGSPNVAANIVGGDGITVTTGSPEYTVAVDSTVARVGDNVSQFVNDAGYLITIGSPVRRAIGSPATVITQGDNISLLTNDAGYLTSIGSPLVNGTLGNIGDVTLSGSASGDVLYYNGTNWINLGIGTVNQVLTVGSPITEPKWKDLPGDVTGISDVTAGDGITVIAGSPVSKRIVSVNSTVLRGTATGSPTIGDILYDDGSGNFVRLPRGTAGQVLTMGSPLLPKWTELGSPISGLRNVVEDLTPQLGGNLEGQELYGVRNIRTLEIVDGGSPKRALDFDFGGTFSITGDLTNVNDFYWDFTNSTGGDFAVVSNAGPVSIYVGPTLSGSPGGATNTSDGSILIGTSNAGTIYGTSLAGAASSIGFTATSSNFPTAPHTSFGFTSYSTISFNSGANVDINDAGTLRIKDAGDTDYVAFSHDGTDFNMTGTNTGNLNIINLTGRVRLQNTLGLDIRDGGDLRIRASGNTIFATMSHDGTDFNLNFGSPSSTTDWNITNLTGRTNFLTGVRITEPYNLSFKRSANNEDITFGMNGSTLEISGGGDAVSIRVLDVNVIINDNENLILGTGNDALLYSTGFNTFFDVAQGSRDAFFRGGSNGSPTGSMSRMVVLDGGADRVQLYQANVEVARTASAATGGFFVNNTATGAGFERVLTTSDLGAGSPTDFPNITGGDGITVTTGSPEFTVAVDSTVARLAGSPITTINSDSFALNQTLRIYNSIGGDYADFSHDGTDFNTDFTNTNSWNIDGLSGNNGIKIYDSAPIQMYSSSVGGSPTELRVRLDSGNLRTNFGSLYLGPGPHTTSNYKLSSSNTSSLIINSGGSPSTGGVIQFNLGGTQYFRIQHSSTQVFNVLAAFSGASVSGGDLSVTGGNNIELRDGGTLRIRDAGDTDYVSMSHDGTDFNAAFTNTTDWNVTGLTNGLVIDSGATGGPHLRLAGSNNPYIQFAGGQFIQGVTSSEALALASGNNAGAGISFNAQNSTGTVRSLIDGTKVLEVLSDQRVRVYDVTGNDYANFRHDGTDFNLSFANTRNFTIFGTAGSPSTDALVVIPGSPQTQGMLVRNLVTGAGLERVLTTSDLGVFGSPTDQLHVVGGDGITTTYGSPEVTVAVDSTVARLSQTNNGYFRIDGSPITTTLLINTAGNNVAPVEISAPTYTQSGYSGLYLRHNTALGSPGAFGPGIIFGSATPNSVATVDGAAIHSVQFTSDPDNCGLGFSIRADSNSTPRTLQFVMGGFGGAGGDPRFGIGTSTPEYNLDVSGNARFTSTIYPESGIETSFMQFKSVGSVSAGWVDGGVILLFNINTDDVGDNNYIFGEYVIRRSTSLRNALRLSLDFNTDDNGNVAGNARATNVVDYDNWRIVTCTYNGEDYLGIEFTGNTPRDGAFFTGIVNSSGTAAPFTAVQINEGSPSLLTNVQTYSGTGISQTRDLHDYSLFNQVGIGGSPYITPAVELDVGGTIRVRDGGQTDWVQFSHDGTDFNIAATNTTDINITGANISHPGLEYTNGTFSITTSYMGATNSTRSAFLPEAPSNTNPNIVPRRDDLDTGIGWAATNQLSLVAGGYEAARFSSGSPAPTLQVFGDITGSVVGQTLPVVAGTADQYLTPGSPTTQLVWKSLPVSATGISEISGGDGINVTVGSPLSKRFVAVDNTVARLVGSPIPGAGSPLLINTKALALSNTLRIYDSGITDYGDFYHDGTHFYTTFTNTADWIVSGLASEVKINDAELTVEETGGAQSTLRIGGPTVRSSNSSDARIIMFGENIGTKYGAEINIPSSYLQILGSTEGGATAITGVRSQVDLDMYSGSVIRVRDSGGTDWIQLSHDGTDANIDFNTTTDLNLNDGIVFKIWDSGNTDNAAFSHDGTDFNTVFTNTADWNVTGLTNSAFSLDDGGRLRIRDSDNDSWALFSHDGTDFNIALNNSTDLNFTGATDYVFVGNIVGNVEGQALPIAAGAAGQVLVVGSPTSQLVWKTLSVADLTGSPVAATNVVGGDGITVTTGSPEVTVAVDATVLRTTSILDSLADVNITGGAGSPNRGVTGDTLYFNGTSWVNLGIGAADQVLTVGSPITQPKWKDLPVTATGLSDVKSGDGITVTVGSPTTSRIVAVDSTVARLTGSPPVGSPSQIFQGPQTFLNNVTFETNPTTVDGTGVKRPVGLGVFPPYEIDISATFDTAHAGMVWHVDAGSPAVTFTAPNDSTIEIGSMWQVQNDDVENVTIAAGSPSVTILRLGAGGAPISGNVLVQQGGIVTIYKYTDTEYWVYGDSEAIGFGSPVPYALGDLTDVTITTAANGDLLYYNGTAWVNIPVGAAGEVLTVAGSPISWQPGGGVNATTGADNRIAVFTTASDIEGDASFTWDASTATLTLFNTADTDSAAFQHDGTDFNTTFNNTTDWNINGLTGAVNIEHDTTAAQLVVQPASTTGQDAELEIRGARNAPSAATQVASLLLSTFDNDIASNVDLARITSETVVGSDTNLNEQKLAFYYRDASALDEGLYLYNGEVVIPNQTFKITDSSESDWLAFSHDGTDFNIAGTNTTDINITGVNALVAVNYNFDIDQTVGAGQDNFVLTYDNGDGQISLEAVPATNVVGGDGITVTTGSPEVTVAVDATVFRTTNVLNDIADVSAGSPTIGAVLYNDGTNWLKLARGTSGQILTMGSPLLPSWQAAPVGGSPLPNLQQVTDKGSVTTNTVTANGVTIDNGTIAMTADINAGGWYQVRAGSPGGGYGLYLYDFGDHGLYDKLAAPSAPPVATDNFSTSITWWDVNDYNLAGIDLTTGFFSVYCAVQGSTLTIDAMNDSGVYKSLQLDPDALLFDVRDGLAVRIRDAGDTDYVDFSHDGTDFNIAGTNTTDINVSGLTNLNITGALNVTNTITIGSPEIIVQDTTETVVGGSPAVATPIASHSITLYRSVEYQVQATRGNNYHATKILAIHGGSPEQAEFTEYGSISIPSFFGSPSVGSPINSGEQATFTADVNGGNLRLLATPRGGTGNITFKVVSNLITV